MKNMRLSFDSDEIFENAAGFFVCVSIILKAAIKALIYFVLKIRISYRLLINTGNA